MRPFILGMLCGFSCFCSAFAQREAADKMLIAVSTTAEAPWITGSVFVANADGAELLNDAGRLLKAHETVSSKKFAVRTGATGFCSLVFSNHMAVHCGPNTHFEILEFDQKLPDATLAYERDYEMSRSRVHLRLVSGNVVMQRATVNPASTFRVSLPRGEIETLASSFMLEWSIQRRQLWTLDGPVRFQLASGESLLVDSQSQVSWDAAEATGYAAVSQYDLSKDRERQLRHLQTRRILMLAYFDLDDTNQLIGKAMLSEGFFDQTPYDSHRIRH